MPTSQDGSARSDPPVGGQKEHGGISHSDRMMADMMKMLANRRCRTSSYYSSIYSNSSKPRHQQATVGYSSRWRPEKVVNESGGAREGHIVDSSGPLVRETAAKLES